MVGHLLVVGRLVGRARGLGRRGHVRVLLPLEVVGDSAAEAQEGEGTEDRRDDRARCDVGAVRLGQQRLTALTRVVAVLRLGGDILRGLALSRLAPRVDLDQGGGARGQVLDRARALRAPG